MAKRPKRKKLQRADLEHRLYKTERRTDKLNAQALMLRQAIEVMDKQELERKKQREVVLNKALQDAAIKSASGNKGGTDHASNRGE